MSLRERLGSLVPDGVKRHRAKRDAAFLEAAREAYRAAAREAAESFEGPVRVDHRSADRPPAASTMQEEALSAARARVPEVEPATQSLRWATALPKQQASQPPTALSPASLPADDARAQAAQLHLGEASLDHLLRVPDSVDVAADDFFGGLARRVEGDR